MIRVDRSLQDSVNILPDSHLAWQPNDSDFIQHLDPKDQPQLCPPTPTDPPRDRSSSLSPAPDSNSPQTQPEAPSSPVAAEEREEAVKVPQREEEEEEETRVEKASRLSTPLSELSPPPDDLDVTVDPSSPNELKALDPAVPDGSGAPDAMTLAKQSHTPDALPSPNIPISSPSSAVVDVSASKSGGHKVITILNLNSELLHVCIEFQKKGVPPTDALYHHYAQRLQSNLAWLAAIADQSRPMTTISLPIIDAPPPVDFYSCERMQQLYNEMPSFFAKEIARRNQLGIPLIIPGSGPFQSLNPSQKRERSEDNIPDPTSKRQHIGDVKPSLSQLMPPPPSIPNLNPTPASNPTTLPSVGLSMPNGQTGPSTPTMTSQQFSRQSPDANASHTNMPQQPLHGSQEAQMMASVRARQQQAQLRAQQQQQQHQQQQQQQQHQQQQQQQAANSKQPNAMLGPSNGPTQGIGPGMNTSGVSGGQMGHGAGNAAAGHHAITMQQAVQILQNPNHPIIQYLMRAIPGFQSLNQQMQLQKIAMAAIQMQNRNQQQSDQQRAAAMPNAQQMQGMSMQNSAGGMSFPMANGNPAQFSGLGMGQQNNMFPAGMQNANLGAVAGAGGMSGVNMNHQRQMMMMQQQQRAGGNMAMGSTGAGVGTGPSGPGGSGMMMNPQQMGLSQQQLQQQQLQQQQQQRMGVNMGSPMLGGTNDFPPTLRSNNPIPGIARSTRSPSDGSSGSMTPRPGTAVGRGASLGQEDYQRMMMKQQQGQNSQGTMFGSAGGAAQGMMGGNWAGQQGGGMGMGQSPSQNQNIQLQGMQMQGGYGMSSPIQAQQQPQQHQQAQPAGAGLGSFMGGVSASPPPMGVSSPTWAGSPTQQGSVGPGGGGMSGMFSPFSPTGGSLGDISRHMSGTPGPPQSQTSSLTGSQDDYSGLFDWPS